MLTNAEKDAIRVHYRTLSESLPGFRPRAAQREMLAAIAVAFSQSLDESDTTDRQGESIVVIEGPTGVGKSLAYLLSGALMARARNKKLIVSSATIALQEQLVHRDIPFLLKHSGLAATYALAKGRGRYLCPYRLYQFTSDFQQTEFFEFDATVLWDKQPQAKEISQLKRMADLFHARRWNGDRDEYADNIEDKLWSRVTNDRHGCLKATCPNRQECPFFIAREAIQNVDIVVTNHDLLLADAAMGGGVILPPPAQSFFCIDEGHHLAKKAINQFSAEHSLGLSLYWLERVPALIKQIKSLSSTYSQPAELAIEASQSCLESLSTLKIQLDQSLSFPEKISENHTWLFESKEVPEEIQVIAENIALSTSTLLNRLDALVTLLSEARKVHPDEIPLIDQTSSALGMILGRAEGLAAVWALMLRKTADQAPPIARWITKQITPRLDYIISASPVSAASDLVNSLWKKVAGAVITSATLRSLGRFDLVLDRTGLHWMKGTQCLALESPFCFEEQGELYLPPLQSSPRDSESHTAEIIEWLPKLIDIQHAVGSLVLFSSRKQMQAVLAGLPTDLSTQVLMQGEQSKSKILSQHFANINHGKASIIFGLDSFAEGLDLPGEACVHVIIAKLPFSMPDDPVDKTLAAWIESKGGNPFLEITVPEASIKLIQATGRLIRTENDYGRVTILDNRLLKQPYGRKLLAALPPFKRLDI